MLDSSINMVTAHQHCWCCGNRIDMKMLAADVAIKRPMTWECKDCQVLLNTAPCRSDVCERGLENPGGTSPELEAVS